jgi:hypothetical protein
MASPRIAPALDEVEDGKAGVGLSWEVVAMEPLEGFEPTGSTIRGAGSSMSISV